MSTVIGLDLSLTSTGVATILTGDGRVHCTVRRITSKGRQGASLPERYKRLNQLEHAVWAAVQDAHKTDPDQPPLVVVEAPSFGSQNGHMHDRSGLWWLVVAQVARWYDLAEVAPGSLKKYATGKGNAGKDAVLAAVIRRYPAIDVTGNDEADALVLAAMGARHLGHPVEESLPPAHLAAMGAVKWPIGGA
jgi:crossover junction endodeoxyribonuclease RuvC